MTSAAVADAVPSGHVIVCGLGNVGFRLVQLFARLGERVVVVTLDARERWLREARALGVTLLSGDARDPEVLAQAGVARATVVIAATDGDLVNLEIGLDARRKNPRVRLVLRVFDMNLGRSIEETLGQTRALGSSALAGPRLGWAALGETVLGSFDFAGRALLAARLDVDAASGLAGLDRASAFARGVLVLDRDPHVAPQRLELGSRLTVIAERDRYAELRGRFPRSGRADGADRRQKIGHTLRGIWSNAPRPLRVVFLVLLSLILISVFVFELGMGLSLVDAFYYVVTTVTTTGYGDITPKEAGVPLKLYACLMMGLGSVTMAILYSFATDFVVSERVRAALGRPPPPPGGHVVVVGLGNVGYRTLDELVRTGADVAAVDRDPESEFAVGLRTSRLVVTGDGRLPETLLAAGVPRARAVVSASGDDATNLAVTLAAKRLAPGVRTIARMFDADFAKKVEQGALVDKALSASLVAAPFFAASALHLGMLAAYVDDDDGVLVALRETTPPASWRGKSPSAIAEADRSLPIAAQIADAFIRLDPQTALPDAERLLVLERHVLASEPSSAAGFTP